MSPVGRSTILRVVGALAFVVGAYFPWIRQNPAFAGDAIPATHFTGMEAGIEGLDYLILSLALLLILLSAASRLPRIRAGVTLLVGVGTLAGCAIYLVDATRDSVVGLTASAPFTVALGWYAMVIGGLALTIASGLPTVEILSGASTARPPDG